MRNRSSPRSAGAQASSRTKMDRFMCAGAANTMPHSRSLAPRADGRGLYGIAYRCVGGVLHRHADALLVDRCITSCQILHMRATITIKEELLKEAQKLSGKSGYSDAIVTSLEEYVALRKRLEL